MEFRRSIFLARLMIIISMAVVIFSCKKENDKWSPVEVFRTGINGRVNDLSIDATGNWFACGGSRNDRGYVCLSTDHGSSWHNWQTDQESSVYAIDWIDSLNGFIGGDFLYMWRTFDGGQSWSYYWLGNQVPFNEEDRPAIRDFYFQNDSVWNFCGGENFGEGVYYESVDAGQNWTFNFYQHEYRSICVKDNIIFIGGHGSILSFPGNNHDEVVTRFQYDFITSIETTQSGNLIAASFTGKIYRSQDNGNSWENVVRDNKVFRRSGSWNEIAVTGNHIVIVGTGGSIAESNDGGDSWELHFLEGEPDLYCVELQFETVLAGSDHGIVYQLR